MTDTSKTTSADGSTVTTKVLTEKLQDETGKITQRVTKTVTEAGTKLVDGVERSYKTVTTYVDGLQTKVERSLDDIAKTTTGTKPGSTTPTAPTPDKDLTDAVEANTEALLAANSKLAEMVRQANLLNTTPRCPPPARQAAAAPPPYTLVLRDNIHLSVGGCVAAARGAPPPPQHREGDTNITQNIYPRPRRRQTSSGKPAGKPTGPRPRNDERRAPQCHSEKTICSWSRMPGPLSTSGGTTARPTPSTPSTAWM